MRIATHRHYSIKTNQQRAEIIEYFVNNPNNTLKTMAMLFNTSAITIGEILTRDYFGKKPKKPAILVLQSKINQDE